MSETSSRASVIAALRIRVTILAEDLDACEHDVAAALAEEILTLLNADKSDADGNRHASVDGNVIPFHGISQS